MNGNDEQCNFAPALMQLPGMIWQNQPYSSCSVAVFADHGSLPDDVFLQYLSPKEIQQSKVLLDPVEHRHFIARRCFQRVFVCGVLANDKPRELALNHQRDSQPTCLDAPGLHLSFSSSGTTAIACASMETAIGVDIERIRQINNATALAKRFFSPNEAGTLAAMPPGEQNIHFLQHWTAKEAALKAIGKGIVYGLNTFTVERVGNTMAYNICGPDSDKTTFRLQYLELLPQHVTALVEKIAVGNR